MDNGTVVCSGFSSNTWIFSTMQAPLSWSYDGIHPVAGNRVFSYYTNPNDGSITIYTRGVDRFSVVEEDDTPIINLIMETGAFAVADGLWSDMQDKLALHINTNGGNAAPVQPIKNRPNYEGIRKYLRGEVPKSSLGCK